MSKTKKVSATTVVNGSQQHVFDMVTNWELQSKWIFATKVSGVGADYHKIGGKLKAFTGFGKIGFLDTMTITKWESPRVCEVTHTGKVVKGSGLFEVETKNGHTFFTWTENTQMPFGVFGSAAWLVVGPLTKLGLVVSLRKFRKLV